MYSYMKCNMYNRMYALCRSRFINNYVNVCFMYREKVTQVGKINFKLRPPTALMANIGDFPVFFSSLNGVLKKFYSQPSIR